MNRKYLDDLNITNRPDLWCTEDERQERWQKERELYSFDERETWSLDYTWHLWLYEHIKMYLEFNDSDLNYHRFLYKEKEYSQEELINMILERLEFEFKEDSDESPAWNSTDEGRAYVYEIEDIWAIICHAMWW